jgi:hypothetical protein|eukprot:COSAG01_NODE_7024_length_3399_cov_87.648509_3_plen_295_part_00
MVGLSVAFAGEEGGEEVQAMSIADLAPTPRTIAPDGGPGTPLPPSAEGWLTLTVEIPGRPPWRGLRVRLWHRVRAMRETIRDHSGFPRTAQLRLYSGNTLLANSKLIHDYSSVHDGSTIRVLCRTDDWGGIAAVVSPQDQRIDGMLSAVRRGMARGLKPRLAVDGCGGSYFLHARGGMDAVAIFKPQEEEAGAPMNPRGRTGKLGTPGIKPGVLSGEGAVREVAAALLDADHFSSVPPTALVEMRRGSDGKSGGTALFRSHSHGAQAIAPFPPSHTCRRDWHFPVQRLCLWSRH